MEATQPATPEPQTPAPKQSKAAKTTTPKEPAIGDVETTKDGTSKVYLGGGIFSLDY